MTHRILLESAPTAVGSGYPAPYSEPCRARVRRRLGDAAGLTQFGVNLTRLPSGCWSSQRHWHTGEDEFVFVVEGEVVLVTDTGEETLRAGDSAGFKAGAAVGHQLQNRSDREAIILEVGSRNPETDEVFYPGIDLRLPRGRPGFAHADGTPYRGDEPKPVTK
ncbi:MAG TPA: cupin domain-containing protein [Steroidobacteraceae bacterium]|nr:cupin domain-containing protein [Steroidobacteraceae bacterium]